MGETLAKHVGDPEALGVGEGLPLVSVAIATRDRLEDLIETLERIRLYQYSRLEVVVVDNASKVPVAPAIASQFPEVRVITLDVNRGAVGLNEAIKTSQGEYVAFQDDDSFFHRDGIGLAVEKMAAHPRLGAVAGREVLARSGRTAEFAHKWDPAAYQREARDGRPTLWFINCAAVLRRRALEDSGLFPEEFVWGCEEIDLATRLIINGWEVRYFPDVVAIHRKTPASRNSDFAVFHKTRNLVWYWWSYLPLKDAARKTLVRLPADFLIAVYKGGVRGYFRALLALACSYGFLKRRRTPVPPELLEALHAGESESRVLLEQVLIRLRKRANR
ncbi:MAG: glycosyltransferase family 2 protein [Thermoleophilia bacterium]